MSFVMGHRNRCSPSKAPPPGRVDTSSQLRELRARLKAMALDAFIITRDDGHQSEIPANRDRRYTYISGFSGSDGIAVITREWGAALWTDGRYFLQADIQLSCDWLLMRVGQPGVPHLIEWLVEVLPENSKIGADPKLVPNSVWNAWTSQIGDSSNSLIEVFENPVDRIWNSTTGRPPYSDHKAYVVPERFSGRKWEDKIKDLRAKLDAEGANAVVVTALDEVAWLLNIRGYDIPNNPMVYAYVTVTTNSVNLYVNESKLSTDVKIHLKALSCYSEHCTQIHSYDALIGDLKTNQQKWKKVLLPSRCYNSPGASRAIYSAIPPKKQLAIPSPIIFMKARKNRIEIGGMREAHIRDAVALCDFLAYLEEAIAAGKEWNELQVAQEVDQFRREQNLSRGPSFPTIAGFGPNGASPHYSPFESSNLLKIDGSSTLVLDSGGHYLDGTTDVTRTIHLGTPTDFEREAYTRVLMGSIQLASLVFPFDVPMNSIDVLARGPLWEAGLNYLHATGHGVGAFLTVHEAPITIAYTMGNLTFQEGYFFSDEPGYYHEGHFGVRLENVLEVVKKKTKHNFDGQYFGFVPVTYVPYEPKLINVKMLSPQHRKWLNDYNTKIRTLVGAELKRQHRLKGFYWMMDKTGYIPEHDSSSSSGSISVTALLLTAMQFVAFSRRGL
ncbi:Xaa-Pro aminopeptidase 1 [Cryptotermes secundus]|uniref:Xaa-Pro aminopeptidase 1 n=2 Tax=Cryptotermes secundus TaxID=105785 RepID=A0A2J7QK73_9NEOP|nr:xaa-Pro aminopeptidase 1 isoform X3 [Cryptotermes secundus]XP_033608401.1 xaa-Pro aminopeptidase 1 isoform X3 [Cryptotermes secundus]PNF28969.1 Xaa-Pro aminopeptidase 1 [Cryptotermes secundus]